MTKLTYKVAKDQDALDAKDRMIEKRGHVITFTINQVEEHKVELEKIMKELLSKRDYEKAKMTNIEEHHPYVKEMDAEKLFTVHMYQEANQTSKLAEAKIKEIQDQLDEYETELADILNQVPEVGAQVPAIAVEETTNDKD